MLHWKTCSYTKQRHQVFKNLLFCSKPAANTRLNDPNLSDREVECLGHDPPHVERNLSRGSDNESFILIEVTNGNMRFQRAVLPVMGFHLSLHHKMTRFKYFFWIANQHIHLSGDILLRKIRNRNNC